MSAAVHNQLLIVATSFGICEFSKTRMPTLKAIRLDVNAFFAGVKVLTAA
jgi:hypothetical protein